MKKPDSDVKSHTQAAKNGVGPRQRASPLKLTQALQYFFCGYLNAAACRACDRPDAGHVQCCPQKKYCKACVSFMDWLSDAGPTPFLAAWVWDLTSESGFFIPFAIRRHDTIDDQKSFYCNDLAAHGISHRSSAFAERTGVDASGYQY